MKKMKMTRSLLAACSVVALSVALSGCLHSGDDDKTTTTAPPPPKSPVSYASDLNQSVMDLATLSAAGTEEGSALMMAKKYSEMIGTLATDGNSLTAMENAQMVLDAKADLEDAISAAMAMKMAAKKAMDDLPDDADPAVAELLDHAIMEAETAIEAAEGVLNGDDLMMYVDMVTGGEDADPMGTPASVGKDVAMALAGALGPADRAASSRVHHGALSPGMDIAAANKHMYDDAEGMTWEMIVGADNVMMMRLGAMNAEVQAASIAGMNARESITDIDLAALPDGDGAPGMYMGIPGTVYCLGTTCVVDGDDNLKGDWYFSPDEAMVYYTKAAGKTMYSPEQYAMYGHWLTVSTGEPDVEGQVTVNTYAKRAGGGTEMGNWDAADPSSENPGMRDATATYSGKAAGRSVHKTLDVDGGVDDIQSGRFMADVELTAYFGGKPMLGGTVDGFMSPDNPGAVDSSWMVTLEKMAVVDGGVDGGVTKATGQAGKWEASSYGDGDGDSDMLRPIGIYGGFTADFTDGHVAGAFATRKQ